MKFSCGLMALSITSCFAANIPGGLLLQAQHDTSTGSGQSYIFKADENVRLLNLHGSYNDMGREYGALQKVQLNTMYHAYQHYFQPGSQGESIRMYYSKLIANEEKSLLQGISETSGLSYQEALSLDVLPIVLISASGESFNHTLDSKFGLTPLAVIRSSHCSFLSVKGDKAYKDHSLVLRNMDFNTFAKAFLPYTLIVIYHPNNGDNSVATIGFTGFISGHTVINNKHIFIARNDASTSVPGNNLKGAVDSMRTMFYTALKPSTYDLSTTIRNLSGKTAIVSAILGVAAKDGSGTVYAPVTSVTESYPVLNANYNYFTNLYHQTKKPYPKEALTEETCVSQEGLHPPKDSASHACTRYQHIAKFVADHQHINVDQLKQFASVSVDQGGIYQTGFLKKYPVEEVTLHSIVGDVTTGQYYLHVYNEETPKIQQTTSWLPLDLAYFFQH